MDSPRSVMQVTISFRTGFLITYYSLQQEFLMTTMYDIFLIKLNEWLLGFFVLVRNCIVKHTFFLNASKVFKDLLLYKECDAFLKLFHAINILEALSFFVLVARLISHHIK